MEFQLLGRVQGIKGLNFDLAEDVLPEPDQPVYLRDCNAMLVKNGKVGKLLGTDYLNDVSAQLGVDGFRSILGIPIFRKLDGTKYLLAITPRKAYKLHNDTSWAEIGDIAAGENASVPSQATLDDQFIFTLSDSGMIYAWDGTSFGHLFAAPQDDNLKARFCMGFKTHLILFRTIESGTEYHQRVWPSDAGNIDSFNEENKIDLDAEGKILNAKRLEDEIMVYLEESIHRVWWDGPDYGYLSKPFVTTTGLKAPKTLCGNKDAHFFLGQEGFMRMLMGDIPRSISAGKFDRLILDEIDPVYSHRAVAEYYPHLQLVYLCYPKSGSTYPDTQIIYDARVDEIVSKKTLSAERYSAYASFEKDLSSLPDDERKLYGMANVPIFGDKDGYVREQKITIYQNGAESYESSLTLPLGFFGDRTRNKRLLQVDLLVEKNTGAAITLGVDVSNDGGATYGFNFTLTGPGGSGLKRYSFRSDDAGIPIDCLGKDFKVKVRDVSNPNGWYFRGADFFGYVTTQK